MRKLLLLLVVVSVGLVFIGRLLFLQVYSNKEAEIFNDNAISKVYTNTKRGYVYDRNGKLLVANQPSYDLMVIPKEVDTLNTHQRKELCTLLQISETDYTSKLNNAAKYSTLLASPFVAQLSKGDYAVLQEKIRKYKGFYIHKRSIRTYLTDINANILGDLGEVNRRTIIEQPYYQMGDLIGKQGIEMSYENILRGQKGVKYIQKDKFNKSIGAYKNGIYDTLPKPGKDITITIDTELQLYGQLLMKQKRGGIVAIDPNNGELLAMVTGPNYNPNVLVGRLRSKNSVKLYNDSITKPTYDRGLQAQYAPGSPFKIINALIGLQEGVINPKDKFECKMGYYYGTKKLTGCHYHKRLVNLNFGISESCNSYFVNVYRKIIDNYENASLGMDNWAKHVKSFGLGGYLNNDLAVGRPGRIPDGNYYNRQYGKNRWGSTYNVSNAIGQGEVEATPIQLANMAAAVANRGFYYTPHIIKAIENDTIPSKFKTPKHTTIDPKHFEPVIEGMLEVYKKGTAKYLQVDNIEICGKTGTAENFMKIDGKKTQLTDHSIFVAFAPKDNPKIAIAVFIENGHYGNKFAGKIASLMIEKYINKSISRKDLENWIFTHSLEDEYAKPYSGEPFKINNEMQMQIIDNYAIKYLETHNTTEN